MKQRLLVAAPPIAAVFFSLLVCGIVLLASGANPFEALANVAKHAEATAVQVIAEFDGNEVALRVIDNGRGFAADVEPSIGYLDGQRDSALERRTADLSADMEIRPGPGGGAELIWRAHIFDRP